MITIDGSMGEGGGQIVRTALSLSMLTGETLRLRNIRANRPKSGLMRQHLTAVKAAAEISGAAVEGDIIGSTELLFKPCGIRHGEHSFSIGSAGSATLIAQTLLPVLLLCEGESTLIFEGGTHNSMAPPFDFLERSFIPVLKKMGASVSIRLDRHGFYPAGGGKIRLDIRGGTLRSIRIPPRRGEVAVSAICLAANLPDAILEREAVALRRELALADNLVQKRRVESWGPGNIVMIDVMSGESENTRTNAVFTAFGEKGVTAEQVAASAVREVRSYLATDVAVEHHLTDQLLLPMALAGGGEFAAMEPSLHATTNIAVIQQFLPIKISCSQSDGHCVIALNR